MPTMLPLSLDGLDTDNFVLNTRRQSGINSTRKLLILLVIGTDYRCSRQSKSKHDDHEEWTFYALY